MPLYLMAQVFEGQASFYNDKLHGHETASGEKYDKFAMTAAHRTLPFGTMLKVTNLWNGKNVIVRVNDRGPFGKTERIIDLSMQAALQIEMVTAGIVDVRVEVVKDDEELPLEEVVKLEEAVKKEEAKTTEVRGDGTFKINITTLNSLSGYGVQIGSYADFYALLKKMQELEESGFPDLYMNTAEVKGKRYYRIIIGNFEHRAEADFYLLSVKSKGFDGYVVAHQK